jgi:hypothetical protein
MPANGGWDLIRRLKVKQVLVMVTIIIRLDPHYDQRSLHICLKARTAYTRSAFFWDVMQRIVLIPYRRFGTTYRSALKM